MDKTIEYKGHTIEITNDILAEDPRTFGCIGKMHVPNPPRGHSWGDKVSTEELIKLKESAIIIIPLFAMDHSVVHISAEPFCDPWDSWLCGSYYITEQNIRDWFNSDDVSSNLERAKQYAEAEIELYDKYLNNEALEYTTHNHKGEFVDSCSGFYDLEYLLESAESEIDQIIKQESPLFVAAGLDPWTFEKENED